MMRAGSRTSPDRDPLHDPLERNGTLVVGAMGGLAFVYLIAAGACWECMMCFILAILGWWGRSSDYHTWYGRSTPPSRQSWIRRIIFFFALAVSPALFHGATGKAVIGMGRSGQGSLWDEALLGLDSLFLGWLFPQGQVALWAQDSAWLAPDKALGRFVTEVLQTTYMTYYFYGNVLLLLLLFTSMRNPTSDTHWRRVRMLLYGWVSAYLLNFAINFVLPAVSPRLFLHSLYTSPLEGMFVGRFFQSAIKSAAGGDPSKPSSFGAFPSGHVGLTWLAALSAERLGFRRYAIVCRCGAVLMTCAVVYLRYHYFVDALFAIVLVKVGLKVGRLNVADQQVDRHVCDQSGDAMRDSEDDGHDIGLIVKSTRPCLSH